MKNFCKIGATGINIKIWGHKKMERDKYLKMCQRCSVLPRGIGGVIPNIPDDLIVEYKGIKYYPYRYVMAFDNQGNVINNAVLHELKANCIIECNLSQVKGGF